MLIFNSNNFHLRIEELKDLILKIKIWEYKNSYDKIEESSKEIFSEISHFVVKQFDLASSTIVDHFITNQTDQSAQDFTRSRFAKYFHELTTEQQENYRANVKKYKRKKKQVAKIIQKMLKINEEIRASIKMYIFSKLMFVFIKKILQILIIKQENRRSNEEINTSEISNIETIVIQKSNWNLNNELKKS